MSDHNTTMHNKSLILLCHNVITSLSCLSVTSSQLSDGVDWTYWYLLSSVPLSVSHWVTPDLRDSEANTDPHAWQRPALSEAGLTTHHQLILQPVQP